jgi:hypothetical protein
MDSKPILDLNAFDMRGARDLGDDLEARVQRRARAFGAASVLFYEKPLEFVRGEGCRLYDAAGSRISMPTIMCRPWGMRTRGWWRRRRGS